MPFVVSGNTNATAIMIGELLAFGGSGSRMLGHMHTHTTNRQLHKHTSKHAHAVSIELACFISITESEKTHAYSET